MAKFLSTVTVHPPGQFMLILLVCLLLAGVDNTVYKKNEMYSIEQVNSTWTLIYPFDF